MVEPRTDSTTTPSRWTERHSVQVGELLVTRGLISAQQLADAIETRKTRFPGKPLAEILVELKLVSRRDVVAALAAAVGVPFAIPSARMVRPDALACLPPEFCEANNLLPMSVADGWLTIAAEDFTDLLLAEEIARLSGRKVQVVAAEPETIRQVRSTLVKTAPAKVDPSTPTDNVLAQLDQAGLDELTVVAAEEHKPEVEARDLETAAAGSPIIRLVNHIIKAAVQARASDIHIEPTENEVQIRYRIDGDLSCEPLRPSQRLLPAVISRIKIMAGMDISERRLPQDGGITVVIDGRHIELRVSTMATTFGEKAVIRVVDNSQGVRGLEALGFSPRILPDFRKTINAPNGIVLVTGPTGSGKSTTLYSALSEIVSPKINISSVEDPVEYHLKGINQFQVNPKTGFTFARALRALLRQDPDVLMIGEIRDTETAKLATEAALTGHLVLSTLHTNDAPSAVPRLVNMGVEPYLVAASLRGVLAQRLVRRPCTHCRRRVPLPLPLTKLLAERPNMPPIETVFEGAGCERCRNTGCAGRTGIHELLLTDEEMLQDLNHDLSLQSIRALALKRGFVTLLDDTIEKLQSGAVGIEAIYEVMGACESEPHVVAAAA